MARYRSPEYQLRFESTGLSAKKKFKVEYQDGGDPGFLLSASRSDIS